MLGATSVKDRVKQNKRVYKTALTVPTRHRIRPDSDAEGSEVDETRCHKRHIQHRS